MEKVQQEMAIVLVHEIYGVNRHMEYIQQELSALGVQVVCPDLLNRDYPYTYAEEEVAYRHFSQNIGFLTGAAQIKEIAATLKQKYRLVGVVGFSVGATIAWLCSQDDGCDFIVGAYGSRIRNYTDMEPSCPTLLIFPTEEKAFDVHTLIEQLEQKENRLLEVKSFAGVHGFMDPYSPHFSPQSAVEALQAIKAFVNCQINQDCNP